MVDFIPKLFDVRYATGPSPDLRRHVLQLFEVRLESFRAFRQVTDGFNDFVSKVAFRSMREIG